MATDFVFNVTSGDWNSAGNWFPTSGPPGINDRATVLNGQTCKVESADQSIGGLTINTGGKVEVIDRDLTFSAANTHTINGQLVLNDTSGDSDKPTMMLNGYVEFAGSGTIDASQSSSLREARMTFVSIFTPSNFEIGSSLTVTGSIEFDGVGVNNFGTILVDNANDVMTFGTTHSVEFFENGDLTISNGQAVFYSVDSDEDADWAVTLSGGVLEVASGSLVSATDMSLVMSGGTLTANASLGGKHFAVSGGTITVAANKTVTFNE